MNQLEKQLRVVKDLWIHRHPRFIDDFEAALGEVANIGDPGCIGKLLELFEDDPSLDPPLFLIIHLVESFPDNVYLSELVKSGALLLRQSPHWAGILFLRVINSPTAKEELIRASANWNDSVAESVASILEVIEQDNPELGPKVRAVRERL